MLRRVSCSKGAATETRQTFCAVDLLQVKRLLVRDWLLNRRAQVSCQRVQVVLGLCVTLEDRLAEVPPLADMMINTDTLEIF